MTDAEKREKVIRGLEACNRQSYNGSDCQNCPYYDDEDTAELPFGICNIQDMFDDALAMLKAQDEGVAPIESTTEQKKFADRIGFAVSEFWCGACHFNLIGRPKFCPNCGKKVKWE